MAGKFLCSILDFFSRSLPHPRRDAANGLASLVPLNPEASKQHWLRDCNLHCGGTGGPYVCQPSAVNLSNWIPRVLSNRLSPALHVVIRSVWPIFVACIMTHILVSWISEPSWDVYPVRALVDTAIGFRLLTEEGAISELRNTVVDVVWKPGEPPAPAKLLDFGM